MAMDVQGEKARPYVEKAKPVFPTVVDSDNLLGQLFGFKAIPNGILVDEEGVIRYSKFGGFDIRRSEHAQLLERWAGGLPLEESAEASEALDPHHQQAIDYFRQGIALYHQGKVEEALALWRQGVALEPDNYVIRKQIWAVEHPERFYEGKVDYAWQREQIEQGLYASTA